MIKKGVIAMFILDNIITGDCTGFIGTETYNVLQIIYTWMRIAVPILVVLLITIDMAKAVTAQDDNAIKKAQGHAVKRVIIGVAVFLVPTILDILFGLTNLALGECKFGG